MAWTQWKDGIWIYRYPMSLYLVKQKQWASYSLIAMLLLVQSTYDKQQ